MEMIWDHSTVTQETVYHSVKEAKRQKQTSQCFQKDFYTMGLFLRCLGIAEVTLYRVFDMFSRLNRNYSFQFSMLQSLQCDFFCIKPVELLKYI